VRSFEGPAALHLSSLISIAALPALLLSGLATAAEARQTLSAGELRALFPGQFVAVWKDKQRLEIDAGQGGEVRGGVGVLSSSGRWSIAGNELCLSFAMWTGKKVRCGRVFKDGGWYLGLLRSDGRPRLRFRPR
jgi:hypothetical protein